MDDGKIDRRGRLKVAAFSNGKNQASGSFCLIEEMVDPVRRGFKEEKEKRGCSRGVQPLFFSRQSHLSEKNDAARKDAKYAKFRE